MSTSNNTNFGNALQQQAAFVASADESSATITHITTDHWFNPKATATVHLSDGTKQTMVDCTLMVVGTSRSEKTFTNFKCSSDADLSSFASAKFDANTTLCPALRYKDRFILLGNLTVERGCIGQTTQKGVKRAAAAMFGNNQAFLNFVYKATSPLIIAVVSEFYLAIDHSTKKVSQSSHDFLRLVDKDGKLQPYAEDGEAPKTSKPTSISAAARKLLNIVSDAAASERSSAPHAAKKRKTTKKSRDNSDDDDDEEQNDTAITPGRAAMIANVRIVPPQLVESFGRVASMFNMGNMDMTTLKCHLNDADIKIFLQRYATTPLVNNIFRFNNNNSAGMPMCLMDCKNRQVDFPHAWLGAYESLLDTTEFRTGVESSLGAVVKNTLHQKDASVPEFLSTMTPRLDYQVHDWHAHSPLTVARNGVCVTHVASGAKREAMRCLVATESARAGKILLSCGTALTLTLPDLMAFSIGHRICSVDQASSLPNNITANFIGQDRSTPFFLFFGSMSGELNSENDYINYVGDAPNAANAKITFYPGEKRCSLGLLCDVEAGAPIVIDRGDLFRTIYTNISGKSLPAVTGGTCDILHTSLEDAFPDIVDNETTTPSASVASTSATIISTMGDNSEEQCRQRALEVLNPHNFDILAPSTPSTPKKRHHEADEDLFGYIHYSSPKIIYVTSPKSSPKNTARKRVDALAGYSLFSDEAGFNNSEVNWNE